MNWGAAVSEPPLPRRRLAALAGLCFLMPLAWVCLAAHYGLSLLDLVGGYESGGRSSEWVLFYRPMESLTPMLAVLGACLLSGLLALGGSVQRVRGGAGILVALIVAAASVWIGLQGYKYHCDKLYGAQLALVAGCTLPVYAYLMFLFCTETGLRRALAAILTTVAMQVALLITYFLYPPGLSGRPLLLTCVVLPIAAAAIVISCLLPYSPKDSPSAHMPRPPR